MYFQPVDEMSLRHLFASPYAEDTLRMSYYGPVLNSSGGIESSPDCLVVDKRRETWRLRRCEFKWGDKDGRCCRQDFAHNGRFDVAMVWAIAPPLTREELERELLDQNGCQEVIVMADHKAFSGLEKYRILDDPKELAGIAELRSVLLESNKITFEKAFAAYIAARIYPETFEVHKMVQLLARRFPSARNMQPQGRGNLVGALLQTKPPLIEKMYGRVYRWNGNLNPHAAVAEMKDIIITKYRQDLPDTEAIDAVRSGL